MVLGLLTVLALREQRATIERARVGEALTMATLAKKELTHAYAYTGTWINGMWNPVETYNSERTDKISGISYSEGGFTVSIPGRNHESWLLSFRAAVNTRAPSAPVLWLCGYQEPPEGFVVMSANQTDIPKSYLPAACRGTH